MKRMSPAQVFVWDRRKAAVHEASHVLIARWCGLSDTEAVIFPCFTNWPVESAWSGKTIYTSLRYERLSRIRQMMVAVAGTVGETIWHDRRDYEAGIFWEDILSEENAMSESDWAAVGFKPGEFDRKVIRACERVSSLIGPGNELWSALCSYARHLIVEARNIEMDDRVRGMLYQQYKSHFPETTPEA